MLQRGKQGEADLVAFRGAVDFVHCIVDILNAAFWILMYQLAMEHSIAHAWPALS